MLVTVITITAYFWNIIDFEEGGKPFLQTALLAFGLPYAWT